MRVVVAQAGAVEGARVLAGGQGDGGVGQAGSADMSALARKRTLALSKAYGLLEPGPVLLLTTSHKGAAT